MSTLFARIVNQALITFEHENASTFKTNFNVLKQLVNQLTSKDLNLAPELFAASAFQNRPNRAPVKYIEILEHQTFTMSVFIMENKYTMPMHDHPGHGLLRVISGKAHIQSYTLEDVNSNNLRQDMPSQILRAIEEPAIEISVNNECAELYPKKCNIHQITACSIGPTPAAFFDILSPPYESASSVYGPRKCLFYRKIPLAPSSSQTAENTSQKVYLQRISAPNDYYCDNIYYNPPEFLTNLNI